MNTIRETWDRARKRYPAEAHLPQPTWAVRGLPEGPGAAWASLARVVPQREGPLSIYVHLPFCQTRCPFCDCHATLAPRSTPEAVTRYLETLAHELVRWAALPGLRDRPVTTVHFGGGTPLAVGVDALEGIACAINDAFATHGATEWALETTSRLLDDATLERLERVGFTRVHVGAQSLDPGLRRDLGRREAAETVLSRIAACRARGWVVSADLLYGLPGQTPARICDDIDRLVAEGIHGVSLYHLNAGPHNRPFMERHGLTRRDEAHLFADFTVLTEAERVLEASGLRKNHVTHFARPEDRNLYSRHALRGEDLLAMGSSADGVFGGVFYRHAEVDDYVATGPVPSERAHPPLQGAGAYTPAEERARPLVTALLAAEVRTGGLDREAIAFCEGLGDAGLLQDDGDVWRLTTAGTWFAGAAAREAWGLYA